MTEKITIEAVVNASIEKVWEMFNTPEHVVKWNNASEDWHTPRAENDLKTGGKFNYRMEAKDGSSGFDFTGIYTDVVPNERIAYAMDDGRKVEATFESQGEKTHIVETFEAESENSLEVQREGWQSILDNFKKYVEEQ